MNDRFFHVWNAPAEESSPSKVMNDRALGETEHIMELLLNTRVNNKLFLHEIVIKFGKL